MGVVAPVQSFLFPARIVGIAAVLDEAEKLAVADQVTAGLKRRDAGPVRTVLVVPAIIVRRPFLAQAHLAGGNLHQPVLRRAIGFLAGLAARLPGRMRFHIFQRVLAYQHRGRFQMDALMFDAHQYRPPRMVPVDRQRERDCCNQPVDNFAHPVAVFAHFVDTRPVVMGFVEVVPAHFIDTHREHRFEFRIDALPDQPGQHQLVDEKCRGMAEVENQRVAQRNRFAEKRLIACQRFEKLLVAIECSMEVFANFPSRSPGIAAGQHGSSLE